MYRVEGKGGYGRIRDITGTAVIQREKLYDAMPGQGTPLCQEIQIGELAYAKIGLGVERKEGKENTGPSPYSDPAPMSGRRGGGKIVTYIFYIFQIISHDRNKEFKELTKILMPYIIF